MTTPQLRSPILLSPARNLVAAQQKRIALVIGNSKYQNAPELGNPINDANAMARELGNLGFEVIKVVDGDKKEMDTALKTFALKLSPIADDLRK